MTFNFELILFYATIITGVIALIDKVFLAKKRKLHYAGLAKKTKTPPETKLPILIDYSYSFFPVLLFVFLLRSFLFEPFRIPTGSLEPTLLVGDFILVNKFDYGIRLPVTHKKVYEMSAPKRGDILIFRWPPDPSVDFIKRVIGISGDTISYIDKVLYINGTKIPQTTERYSFSTGHAEGLLKVLEKQENLLGLKHGIYETPGKQSHDVRDIKVPAGMYFVMGDNRDDSADSRFWGFVPEENIVGKATYIWMSWNSPDYRVRWKRIASKIN